MFVPERFSFKALFQLCDHKPAIDPRWQYRPFLSARLMVLFLLTFSVLPVFAQPKDQVTEEAFKATIDQWMRPYRDEKADDLAEWFKQIQKAPASARSHAMYASLRDYYAGHKDTYRQLRLASLRRYRSRPLSYPGYQAVDIGRLWDGDIPLDSMLALYQDIGNVRTFNVEGTGGIQGVLSGLILHYMTGEQKRTITDLSRLLGFGYRLFADEVGPATWNIAYVNRCYVVNYQWNIDNNRISLLSVLVNDGTRQQPGWLTAVNFQGLTDTQRLYHEAMLFRWKLYDELRGESDYINDKLLEEKLRQFVGSHRQEYIQVRREALRRKPASRNGWQAGYQPADSMKDDVLYSLVSVDKDNEYLLNPDIAFLELGGNMVIERFKFYAMKGARGREDLTASWLTGDAVHTRQLEGDRWEVQFFYRQHVLTYQWDIGTDRISQVQCWKKR